MELIKVLVVEDDALIRLVAVDIVQGAGFEVIEAQHADEAMRIVESVPDIQLVFTDIHMPGSMDGLALARRIEHRWPPIRLIITSGKASLRADDLPAGGRFLPKPYTAGQVCDLLGQLAA
jgi:CheY-like chemotaxis protein